MKQTSQKSSSNNLENSPHTSDFENYLVHTQHQIASVLASIKQQSITLEIEQFDEKDPVFCELFEVGAKKPLMHVFSSASYIQEVEEHRFKHLLSTSAKTFKLMQAIKHAKEKHKSIKLNVSQIIQELDVHSIQEKHTYISHLLSLSYYFNWDVEKVSNEVDTQSYILAPQSFLHTPKEKHNLTNVHSIYEDEKICIYLNARHEIICFFKTQKTFTREDIEVHLLNTIKEALNFKSISLVKS